MPPAEPSTGFHELLTVLNPLQYVPVVGNIYRALTGDAPPEPVRIAGSLAFSALTGGPIGVAMYVGGDHRRRETHRLRSGTSSPTRR